MLKPAVIKMTFKEDFPSLKDRIIVANQVVDALENSGDYIGTGFEILTDAEFIPKHDVEEHCLDKAIIRERVEKWAARLKSGDGDWKKVYTENYMDLLDILECATNADLSLHKDLKHLVRIHTESKVLKRRET